VVRRVSHFGRRIEEKETMTREEKAVWAAAYGAAIAWGRSAVRAAIVAREAVEELQELKTTPIPGGINRSEMEAREMVFDLYEDEV